MLRLMIILLVSVFLAGCADPRLDASSPQAFEDSMVEVIEPLSEERRELLADALVVLLLSGSGEGSGDAENSLPPALQNLHGMSADQIISLAEQVLEARQAKRESEE